eukprot:scaffold9302_cov56-Phaeocystis_antarctica.AAC.3
MDINPRVGSESKNAEAAWLMWTRVACATRGHRAPRTNKTGKTEITHTKKRNSGHTHAYDL